jgi:hypothetical protein
LNKSNDKYICPVVYDEKIFENEVQNIKKIAFWEECKICKGYFSQKFLKVILPCACSLNSGGTYTYARIDGARATGYDFRYIDDFCDGFAIVIIDGDGIGLLDEEMHFYKFSEYDWIESVSKGFVIASYKKEIDVMAFILRRRFDVYRTTNNKSFDKLDFFRFTDESQTKKVKRNYWTIESYSEGIFRVGAGFREFDMYMRIGKGIDHDNQCGFWEFADSTGQEIVKPQYFYAYDFHKEHALVCKGEWTKIPDPKNEDEMRCYWEEKDMWGMIDKTGKEVIPCIYADIRDHLDADLLWVREKYTYLWGIMNYSGKWLVNPCFEHYGYDFSGDNELFLCKLKVSQQ